MRGVKAEGGWAVVCTEEIEIHHTSEVSPYVEGRLWSDDDIPALARMTEQVHAHGSLAGIELCHNGLDGPNLYTGGADGAVAPAGADQRPGAGAPDEPATTSPTCVAGTATRSARSLQAGFDLVYVYSATG